LTEFSIVPIPSNPQALVQQRAISSDQLKIWTKDIKDWALKLEELSPSKAQAQVAPLLKEGTVKPWAKDAAAWAAFEKDYDIEAETKALPVSRIAKLMELHGYVEEAQAIANEDPSGVNADMAAAHAACMDAYANAHHADAIMQDLFNAGDLEKALSGNHMTKVREAHGAIARAKGHAMSAAQMIAGHNKSIHKWTDAEIQKHLDDAKAKGEHQEKAEPFLTLVDNPNSVEIQDDIMKDVMASLGPELAVLIAGETRATLNQMLGRID
jgi:hypothetical protein